MSDEPDRPDDEPDRPDDEPDRPDGEPAARGEVVVKPHFLRRPGPWCVMLPIGLLLGSTFMAGWMMAHPLLALSWSRPAMARAGWQVDVDDVVMDLGDGWTSPGSWSWHVRGLTIAGLLRSRMTISIDEAVLAVPLPSWTAGGLRLTVRSAAVQDFAMYFPPLKEPIVPPPQGSGWLTLVVKELTVDHFGLKMDRGRNPEVIVDARDVALMEPFWIVPARRELTGLVSLAEATAEVAGVRVHDVHPSRIAFTGLGFEVVTRAMLGNAIVDATLEVNPLIGPAQVKASAHLHEGTLDGLGDAILGSGDMQLIGRVEATASMVVGGDLGPGNLKGVATVNVVDAGFARPESHKAAVVLAVHLAPFLHFDEAGNVVVGDFHGDVSFTQRGVSFDTVTYEAPHSVGELRGYVRSTGISAKLHFRPRPGGGAIEWGFVLRGDVRKPKVALALPSVLRSWTPCEDPMDCPQVGGAPKGEPEGEEDPEASAAALAREARAAAGQDRRDDRAGARDERVEARDERKTDRGEKQDAAREAKQEER